jgi:hypothetical protein
MLVIVIIMLVIILIIMLVIKVIMLVITIMIIIIRAPTLSRSGELGNREKVSENHFLIDWRPDSESPGVN